MEPPQHTITGTHPQLNRHKAMLHTRQKATERCSQVYREDGCIMWGVHTPTIADGLRKPSILLNILLLINECVLMANMSHVVPVVYICKCVCICVCIHMLVCIHACMYVCLVYTCVLYSCMWHVSVCTSIMFILHIWAMHIQVCAMCVRSVMGWSTAECEVYAP